MQATTTINTGEDSKRNTHSGTTLKPNGETNTGEQTGKNKHKVMALQE